MPNKGPGDLAIANEILNLHRLVDSLALRNPSDELIERLVGVAMNDWRTSGDNRKVLRAVLAALADEFEVKP